jgi:hypothetical protein
VRAYYGRSDLLLFIQQRQQQQLGSEPLQQQQQQQLGRRLRQCLSAHQQQSASIVYA